MHVPPRDPNLRRFRTLGLRVEQFRIGITGFVACIQIVHIGQHAIVGFPIGFPITYIRASSAMLSQDG